MPLEKDKSNGFKLSLKPLLPSGLYPGLFARSAPLWRTGENIQFSQQGVEKIPGWSQLFDTGAGGPIRGLLQTIEGFGTEAVVYAGDLTSVYRFVVGDASATEVGSGFNLSEESGSAVWDTGTSTWDAGSTVWDYGVIRASHWSFVPFGEWVLGAYGGEPVIRKGTGDFVGMYQGVTGGIITNAGSGYVVNDVITPVGGDGSSASAVVTAVDGSGGVTGIGMTNSGSGYTTAPTSTSGGSGGSAGLAVTWTICDIDVSTVDIFLASGPHVLGFGTSTSPKEFIWCDADDPDTWVAAADNLAGQLEIRELQSPIRAAVQLGSRIAVYGTDQMFLVSYLANDLVFGYQPALNGIGAVSKKAVVSVDRKNYGLSEQGFFVTDGASFEYIDEPAVREYYESAVNRGQLSKAEAFHDEENTQVRWFFPTDAITITQGLSFNYKTNTWSILTATWSAGDERRVAEGPILGSEDGIVYVSGTGANAGLSPITAWVRSKPMDMDNADVVKELDSIRIGYEGMGLTFRVGHSHTEDGTITWRAYTDVAAGFDFVNLRTAGRWLHLELYTSSLNAEWTVSEVELIGRMEGSR